ncbi:hypothetical protein [Lelliottia wanjuensis]|uniref:hypothetical protein n=1 Tax=Lelliottia wanjuensis TaxID=3050585 RepID=UPI00254E4160|nr:hypothetical protein [Lelliottia sp. V86_10]MDK9585441.1 hypothetical protein [Lelliottia sp. V86_10]
MTNNKLTDDHGLSAHLEALEAMTAPGDTENQQLICLLLELKRRRTNQAALEAELENYRNAQQHPAATLYNGSGRVSVMMVSDLPAGEVDVYTTPQPVPVAHDNFMMPPRIENIELRSPLEVEDMWRARVRHMFRASGLKLHEDESK